WHIGFLDSEYPAFANLVEPASMYQSVLIYKHIRMASVEGLQKTRILARLDDGEPLLAIRSVGNGKVLMLGAAAHVNWTNLPLRPIFLPLITRLTYELLRVDKAHGALFAGSPIVLEFVKQSKPVAVEVLPPSGEPIRGHAQNTADGKKQIFQYKDTHEIGVYRVRLMDEPRDATFGYAINSDPLEAEPAKIRRETLEKHLGKTPLMFAANPDDLSATFALLREGQSLWDFFLGAVLVCLVGETLISNWISHEANRREKASIRSVF
ncbi:MAG: hypothetical protein ACWGMZ_08180, partial [Thermoguttaceae bacterium]